MSTNSKISISTGDKVTVPMLIQLVKAGVLDRDKANKFIRDELKLNECYTIDSDMLSDSDSDSDCDSDSDSDPEYVQGKQIKKLWMMKYADRYSDWLVDWVDETHSNGDEKYMGWCNTAREFNNYFKKSLKDIAKMLGVDKFKDKHRDRVEWCGDGFIVDGKPLVRV